MMFALEMLRNLDSELLLERRELPPVSHRVAQSDAVPGFALGSLVVQIVALWLSVGGLAYWLLK